MTPAEVEAARPITPLPGQTAVPLPEQPPVQLALPIPNGAQR